MQTQTGLTYGSCFTGAGFLDKGFELAGFNCRWMIEYNADCQRLLKAKHPDIPIHGDIKDVEARALEPVDMLIGGFPCVDLANMPKGSRLGLAGQHSGLFFNFARLVFMLKPKVFVLENVKELLSKKNWEQVRDTWQLEGYILKKAILSAPDFGSMCRRTRAVIVGYRADGKVPEILDTIFRPCPVVATDGRKDRMPIILPWKGGLSLERLGSCTFVGLPRPVVKSEGASIWDILEEDVPDKYTESVGVLDRLFAAEGGKIYNRVPAPGLDGVKWKDSAHESLRGRIRRLTPAETTAAMGLPRDYTDGFGFRDSSRWLMSGNGVPVPMAKAVADWIMANWGEMTQGFK